MTMPIPNADDPQVVQQMVDLARKLRATALGGPSPASARFPSVFSALVAYGAAHAVAELFRAELPPGAETHYQDALRQVERLLVTARDEDTSR